MGRVRAAASAAVTEHPPGSRLLLSARRSGAELPGSDAAAASIVSREPGLSRCRCPAGCVRGEPFPSAPRGPAAGTFSGGWNQPLGSPGLCRHQPLSRSLQAAE
ncbi:unnamed protein product [Caretta caretta]